jgi:hypothetical protein
MLARLGNFRRDRALAHRNVTVYLATLRFALSRYGDHHRADKSIRALAI